MLDLFAGSGALGMEAWSRGARSVTFVEQHPKVWKNLQENIEALKRDELGDTRCIKADAIKWLARAGESFDLILADPPYDLPHAFEHTLAGIAEHSVLTAGGILVYELRSKGPIEISDAWTVVRDKKYGKTRVLLLKINQEDET